MAVHTKRVYEPREPADGHRLLVMRLWPRGVRKTHVDAWERDLAPSIDLLRAFRQGVVSWGEYAERYRAEVSSRPHATELIAALRAQARAADVTLLCGCVDDRRCHRSLLRDLIVG